MGQTGTLPYLQKVDYSYNSLGWLTGINSPSTALGLGISRPLANCDFPVPFAPTADPNKGITGITYPMPPQYG